MKLLELASMKIGISPPIGCLSGTTAVTNEKRRRILPRILITTNQSKNGSPYSELVFKTDRIIDKHAISICYSLP